MLQSFNMHCTWQTVAIVWRHPLSCSNTISWQLFFAFTQITILACHASSQCNMHCLTHSRSPVSSCYRCVDFKVGRYHVGDCLFFFPSQVCFDCIVFFNWSSMAVYPFCCTEKQAVCLLMLILLWWVNHISLELAVFHLLNKHVVLSFILNFVYSATSIDTS
jgi:hypothetical protein